MRGKKSARIGLLVTALLGGGLAVTQPVASADPSTSISLKPIDTKCTDKQDRIKWRGGESHYSHIANVQSRPRGTMYTCWALFKVREDSKRFDWWVAHLETRWFNASGPTQWTADAYMSQQISSTHWAADKQCGQPFTVSAGFYGASVSSTQQPCDSYRATRRVFDGNSAFRDSAKVGKIDRVETVYMQKGRQGSTRPTFSFGVEIPRYTYEHNGVIWMRNTNYKWVTPKI